LTSVAYVDASALVKLVIDEPDSTAMHRWYIESERVVSSRVGLVEVRRAARRRDHDRAHLDAILETVEVFEFDADVADRAALVGPTSLRTLDAVHLATALAIPGLGAFVTYDDQLAVAARAVGLPVVRPA